MSDFWSTWVIVFIVISLGLTVFLFLWGPRVDIPTQPDGTSGHVWAHGVLRESVRNLPLWWLVISAICLAAALVYLALYPGFGAYKGYLGWTSHAELASDQEANLKLITPLRERIRGKSVESIARDIDVLRAGSMLFVENCAACHGRDGRGNVALGAPDLTDADWIYGGDSKAILTSILDGRQGVMPPFGATLTDAQIVDVAHYVASLSGKPHDSLKSQLGKPLFAACGACHGADGKGNMAMGAPNLTDTTWIHGGNLADIVATIRNGRNGVMPAWRVRLGEEDALLVATWVYTLSHPTNVATR